MRRTRFMTWVFLVLALAFFLVRNFRYALEAPLASLWEERMFSLDRMMSSGSEYTPWLARRFTLERYASRSKLVAMADEAARRGDSDFVAFAALNLGPKKDALRLADRAVAANPDLTWTYSFLALRFSHPFAWESPSEVGRPDIEQRIERLVTFDPDNAVPYLLKAQFIKDGRGKDWPQGSALSPEFLEALAHETAWREQMEKGFAAPHYDSYRIRHFNLTRHILREHRWDHPLVVAFEQEYAPLPDLFGMRNYANLLVYKYGAEAEAAGKMNEALVDYSRAAEFGNRLRAQKTLIEQLIGVAIELIGYRKLAPALRKSGREPEARLAEDADRQAAQFSREFRNPLRARSDRFWLVLLVNLSAGLVAVFLLASLISVGYVNAKLWLRKEKKGRMYEVLTVAENYAPLLLFLSCLALYLSDVPFGRNFENYMTVTENISTLGEGESSIYPAWGLYEPNSLDVPNAFQDYVPVAFAGIVLLAGVLGFTRWRESRKDTLPEPSAFEGKLRTQNYAVLLLVALAAAALVTFIPPWEFSLTIMLVFALVVGGTLRASTSYARRARREEKDSWAARLTEAGAYLLLLLLAGVAGGSLGDTTSRLVCHCPVTREGWVFNLALGLPFVVTGVVSATRLRFRRVTPAAFAIIVIGIMAWMALDQWRDQKKSHVAEKSAATRIAPSVPPALTLPEALVSVAEGKPSEALAQAATARGVSFGEWVYALWMLREAGADDKLIKNLRGAKWGEVRNLEKGDPQIEESEKALRTDLKQNPKNPILHFALGQVLGWQENKNAAIAEYRAAMRLKPDFAGAHRALGEALEEKGEHGPAITELRQAVRFNPKDALARRSLANALWTRDEHGAIREYREETSLEPDDWQAHVNLATLLRDKGDLNEAIQEYREAVRLEPFETPFIRMDLVEALRKNGGFEEATRESREVLRSFPRFSGAHNLHGEVLAEQGELTAAIKEFREAMRLDPKDGAPHNNLGLALQRAGDSTGTIAQFQQAIRLDNKDADAHLNLGRALEKKGDLRAGLEQYQIALSLKPKDAQIQADYQRLAKQLSQKR